MSAIGTNAVVVTGSLPEARLITIAVLAMGGEGGGVLADWIVDLAEHTGYFAQSTSVPGVAQRTGATIYYIEIFPRVLSKPEQEPVLALMPVPGQVDVVIASELMEAGRAIQRGFVTPDRTTLIASTNRVYSMTERIAMADGRADTQVFLDAAKDSAKRLVTADFAKLAEKSGAVISAALFGGLAGTSVLPFSRELFESAIRRGGIGIEASLRAFAAGYDAARREGAKEPEDSMAEPILEVDRRMGPMLVGTGGRIEAEWPEPTHEILFPAVRRLAEFQDVAYAEEFLVRLKPVLEVDDAYGDGAYALTREAGRYFALWASYEDAVRVADLKIRSNRFQRVQRDSHVQSTQLLEINEFLSPQPQEIADLLPVALGERLMRSEGLKGFILRFTGGGKVIKTSSIAGFVLLYLLAKLRFLRRRSLRFHVEHATITRWLDAIVATAPQNYAAAAELAETGQLIKGYANTHALGTRNFERILALMPTLLVGREAAKQLKLLRQAALSDDTGSALEAAAKTVSVA